MRVLLTGATGFLGVTLMERVPETITAIGASHSREADLRWDITDPVSVTSTISSVRPDAIVHCAAMSLIGACTRDPEQAFAINADGAGYVATAAAAAGARLIALSTDNVFDGTKGMYVEDDERSPINAYGRSKAAGEDLIRAAHPAALIVRTSAMIGRNRSDRYPFSSYVLDHDPAEPLELFADEIRSFVPVTTMADAVWELVPTDIDGVLHVAASESTSRSEFGRALLAAAGKSNIEILESSSPPGRANDLSLNVDRASRLLTTRLPTIAETIAEVMADRAG
ncbi:MAG: SDR family oxidoreductase [Acidimicrobiia bacterium]|nr:SDR family oxidoreductase [Acidimicrobiia bacterium]